MTEVVWHTAPDGRRFKVGERRCSHDACWAAWCECGELLTCHDFDADDARTCALSVLGKPTDARGRGRGWSHSLAQCTALQGRLM